MGKKADLSTEIVLPSIAHLKAPASMTLELTYDCPANCHGCPRRFRKSGSADTGLTLSGWKEIIEGLIPHVEEVRLSGGEPFLSPDFFGILEFLEEKKIPFLVLTAGLWNDPSRIITMLRKNTMLRGLSFSVHGPVAQIHDFFLGFAGFELLMDAVRLAKTAGIAFQTSTVLGEFNKRAVKEIVRVTLEHGSRAHLFHRYIGPVRGGISIYRDDLAAILSYCGELSRKGLPVSVDGCFPACYYESGHRCPAGITQATIDPYGALKTCSFSPNSKGSLVGSSLVRLWKGKAMRADVLDIPEDCNVCALRLSCRGGCHVTRELFGIRCDPLMEEPCLSVPAEVHRERDMCRDLRPCARFLTRKEAFGYSLILSGQVIPVTPDAKALLSRYTGKNTIGEIEKEFGAPGLLFTGFLHDRGFLEYNEAP